MLKAITSVWRVLNRERILKILAAVDGSENSQKALRYATELAEKLSGEVTVLNAFHQDIYDALSKHDHKGRPIDEYIEDARLLARQMAQKVLKKTVKMQCKGAVGYPAEEIVDEGLEGKYDFIVMGFHGLRGLARLKAMGSVSRRVLETSTIPVLIVPS